MGGASYPRLHVCCDKIGLIYISFLLTVFPIYCFSIFPNDNVTNSSSYSRISDYDWFVHENNRTQSTTKYFLTNLTSTINISNNTTLDDPDYKSPNDTEADEKGKYPDVQNSSLNLAIIPCIAIIILVVVLCMVCHKWFVRYLRKGTKEVGASSYIIVEEDDDDFKTVEITSDSASSAYNDTESSFCSYLRKSVYDSLTSSRSIKFDSQQHDTVCSETSFQETIHSVITESQSDINNTDSSGSQRRITSYSELDTDLSSKDSGDVKESKPFSSKGASTELDSVDDENENVFNDSKTQRRMQRFKVSFVTEDETRSLCSKQSKGVRVLNHKTSILKSASSETHHNVAPSINSPRKEGMNGDKAGWIIQSVDNGRTSVSTLRTLSSRAKPDMVDVSTQTARTIFWNRRRCKSESDSTKKIILSMAQPVEIVMDQTSNAFINNLDVNDIMKSGGIRRIPLLQKSQSVSGAYTADCVLECCRMPDAAIHLPENQSFYIPDEVATHNSTNGCKSVDLMHLSDYPSIKENFVSDICMHYNGEVRETASKNCAQRSDITRTQDFSHINSSGSKGFSFSVCSLCKGCYQSWMNNEGKIRFCGTVSDGMVETSGHRICEHITSESDKSFAHTETKRNNCTEERNDFKLRGTCLKRQALYRNCDNLSCNESISSGYVETSSESINS